MSRVNGRVQSRGNGLQHSVVYSVESVLMNDGRPTRVLCPETNFNMSHIISDHMNWTWQWQCDHSNRSSDECDACGEYDECDEGDEGDEFNEMRGLLLIGHHVQNITL